MVSRRIPLSYQLRSATASKFPPDFHQDCRNLAVDFDGVLHDDHKGYHDGTCYGSPIDGSLDAIKELAKSYRIVIFTAKAKPSRPLVQGKSGKELVEEWLKNHGYLDYISEITSEKPRAFLYIDDNGYRFDNWKNALSFVKERFADDTP